jgi:hypothetical protein
MLTTPQFALFDFLCYSAVIDIGAIRLMLNRAARATLLNTLLN